MKLISFIALSLLTAVTLFEGVAQLVQLGETFMLGLGILLAFIGHIIGSGVSS